MDSLTNGRAVLGIGAIWNIHVPPIDTPIDQAPKLDPTLRPVMTGGQMVTTFAGSIVTRKSIEKYQPLIGMHAHIHESKGVVKIGKTIVLLAENLIAFADFPSHTYVLVIAF